ncbi:MAG TPA: hypothetical protein VFY98_00505 [Intrasporangium sp.]|nr:hypothetical protein [Intrasporangium sp.]
MENLTFAELDTELVSLLPSKETLFFNHNWSNIHAFNAAVATNAFTAFSSANATAVQAIVVTQG